MATSALICQYAAEEGSARNETDLPQLPETDEIAGVNVVRIRPASTSRITTAGVGTGWRDEIYWRQGQ